MAPAISLVGWLEHVMPSSFPYFSSRLTMTPRLKYAHNAVAAQPELLLHTQRQLQVYITHVPVSLPMWGVLLGKSGASWIACGYTYTSALLAIVCVLCLRLAESCRHTLRYALCAFMRSNGKSRLQNYCDGLWSWVITYVTWQVCLEPSKTDLQICFGVHTTGYRHPRTHPFSTFLLFFCRLCQYCSGQTEAPAWEHLVHHLLRNLADSVAGTGGQVFFTIQPRSCTMCYMHDHSFFGFACIHVHSWLGLLNPLLFSQTNCLIVLLYPLYTAAGVNNMQLSISMLSSLCT